MSLKGLLVVFLWSYLVNSGCTWKSSTVTEIYFSRPDLGLLACGLSGRLSSRMLDCSIKNPVYSHRGEIGNGWTLVVVDQELQIELWMQTKTGIVWSNPIPSINADCKSLVAIATADTEYRFADADTAAYKGLITDPPPPIISSRNAEQFIPSDADLTGVVYNETMRAFRNFDETMTVWKRCVGREIL